jgi:uncharacterized protein YjbI with pentapeptide repeats
MITKKQVFDNLDKIKEYINEAENKKEKVGIQIKNRFTDEIIFESTKTTYKEAVEEAISRNANLWNAKLENTNLRNADLWNADLWNADLRNADLRNARFYGK